MHIGVSYQHVLVALHLVLEQPVCNDHIEPRSLREVGDLDLFDLTEMCNELEPEIRNALAGSSLANRVPLDHLQVDMKPLEHLEALGYEIVTLDRLSSLVEKDCVALDLRNG